MFGIVGQEGCELPSTSYIPQIFAHPSYNLIPNYNSIACVVFRGRVTNCLVIKSDILSYFNYYVVLSTIIIVLIRK